MHSKGQYTWLNFLLFSPEAKWEKKSVDSPIHANGVHQGISTADYCNQETTTLTATQKQ